MKQICGKQALFVSLEGLWENMSPSDRVEPVFQRQHRNHVSYCLHVQWCLAWVFIEPDNQIVLKSSWSHSLWCWVPPSWSCGWVQKLWWVPACRTRRTPPDHATFGHHNGLCYQQAPRMRMQPLACALKPLVVNMNSILSIAADMKYSPSSSQQLKIQGHIFAGDAGNVWVGGENILNLSGMYIYSVSTCCKWSRDFSVIQVLLG